MPESHSPTSTARHEKNRNHDHFQCATRMYSPTVYRPDTTPAGLGADIDPKSTAPGGRAHEVVSARARRVPTRAADARIWSCVTTHALLAATHLATRRASIRRSSTWLLHGSPSGPQGRRLASGLQLASGPKGVEIKDRVRDRGRLQSPNSPAHFWLRPWEHSRVSATRKATRAVRGCEQGRQGGDVTRQPSTYFALPRRHVQHHTRLEDSAHAACLLYNTFKSRAQNNLCNSYISLQFRVKVCARSCREFKVGARVLAGEDGMHVVLPADDEVGQGHERLSACANRSRRLCAARRGRTQRSGVSPGPCEGALPPRRSHVKCRRKERLTISPSHTHQNILGQCYSSYRVAEYSQQTLVPNADSLPLLCLHRFVGRGARNEFARGWRVTSARRLHAVPRSAAARAGVTTPPARVRYSTHGPFHSSAVLLASSATSQSLRRPHSACDLSTARDHGGRAVSPLVSHQGDPGHSGCLHVGIVPDDAVGRQVFSGISRFPALSFRHCPYRLQSLSSALKTSMLRASCSPVTDICMAVANVQESPSSHIPRIREFTAASTDVYRTFVKLIAWSSQEAPSARAGAFVLTAAKKVDLRRPAADANREKPRGDNATSAVRGNSRDTSQNDKIDVKHVFTEISIVIGSEFIINPLNNSQPVADLPGNKDKIDVKHIYSEVAFAIGLQFIRPTLHASEPIADLQANTLRIPELPGVGQQPMNTQLRLQYAED
ncbi:hypothetical protein PR048_021781 [Dryococelus australis]|uniref:Uncharacterized protein n=1 Tax=Dryococelus australis TaxID=614101 RepID=A0ABQ9GZ98_9NEOP|nr:hypothetical protein PR048_021781 [Dryococelus australis]